MSGITGGVWQQLCRCFERARHVIRRIEISRSKQLPHTLQAGSSRTQICLADHVRRALQGVGVTHEIAKGFVIQDGVVEVTGASDQTFGSFIDLIQEYFDKVWRISPVQAHLTTTN